MTSEIELPPLPKPDGTAEANKVPHPTGGYEYDEIDAWSEPLVRAYAAACVDADRAAQQERKPMHEDQIDAAIEAWFANDIVAGPRPFSKRMQAALDAATRNTGFPPPSGELSRSMGGRSSEFDGEYP